VTGALVITRGLPASGKSTWARAWVGRRRRRARVNRDDLRMTMFGGHVLPGWQEELVTTAERACVEALLRETVDVVVDDTHLRLRHARAWADVASRLGAPFEVRDFTDVPVEVCLARDAARTAAGERGTGEQVIRDLYSRFLSSGPLPPVPSPPRSGPTSPVPSSLPSPAPDGLPVPATVPTARGGGYLPDPTLPPAWIVDVDGTLALMSGRSPYAWHRVGEDAPNPPVVELVRALRGAGNAIVVVSGRDGVARGATLAWLDRHEIPHDALLMRSRGDARRDSVVKREIFESLIRWTWQIRGVLDDRDQVVRMWRDLGLTCAQVAPGDF
jgi:predicted kinase